VLTESIYNIYNIYNNIKHQQLTINQLLSESDSLNSPESLKSATIFGVIIAQIKKLLVVIWTIWKWFFDLCNSLWWGGDSINILFKRRYICIWGRMLYGHIRMPSARWTGRWPRRPTWQDLPRHLHWATQWGGPWRGSMPRESTSSMAFLWIIHKPSSHFHLSTYWLVVYKKWRYFHIQSIMLNFTHVFL